MADTFDVDAEAGAQQVLAQMLFLEFPSDMQMGLHLAFYRTFAAPRIAELLARTGEVHGHTNKRAADTGLVMYELIQDGLDGMRGRQMVSLLNRVHRKWDITDEDYLYVLCTFIVVPIRWIDQHGWRALLPAAREASASFYRGLGRRMRIPGLPADFARAQQILDDYEDANVRWSAAGQQLMLDTAPLFDRRLPGFAHRYRNVLISALLGDRRICRALGVKYRPVATAAMAVVLQLRNLRTRRRPPLSLSWFRPGVHAESVYPGGYRLEQLGPDVS